MKRKSPDEIRADENLKLREYIIKRFKGWKDEHRSYYEQQKRQDQPLIDVISNLGSEIKSVTEQNKDLITELIPAVRQNLSIPSELLDETLETEEEEFSPLPRGPRPLPAPPASSAALVPSTAKAPSASEIKLGPLATRYLSTNKVDKDESFGLYSVVINGETKYKIGSWGATFDNDDIIIFRTDDERGSLKRYRGTPGLWELLTRKHPKREIFTDADYQQYGDILMATNALYQNNDPRQNRVKSSSSQKYITLIKPIWNKLRTGSGLNGQNGDGAAIMRFTSLPKEFVWLDDVRKLVDRLLVIAGEEMAGNLNFHNEKVSIMSMLNARLSNFIVKDSKGVGYLIKIINILPPRFWQKYQGRGLINDIINKLPFALHLPGYEYCGPGTKLEERLAKGQRGINPLDAACREHDIAYRDHKDLESRHRADKELEHRAFGRVVSKDAGIGERLAALAVTGVMNTKVKHGWGL